MNDSVIDQGEDTAPDTEEGASLRAPERRTGANPQTRYLQLVKVSRLLTAAFWTVMAFFLVWSTPWLPVGLSTDDFNNRVTSTFLLGAASFAVGLTALALREWLRRLERALVAFNSVFDGATGLYNRRYFHDRLTLECEAAQRQGAPFSVLVFQFDTEAAGRKKDISRATLRRLADALVSKTRGPDVVAVLGSNELAVAVVGEGKGPARKLGERLRLAVEAALTERLGSPPPRPVRMGVSEYPSDGSNAAQLLRLAREAVSKPATAESTTPQRSDERVA